MSSARVQKCLSDLFADLRRQDGHLTTMQIERMVIKRQLSPLEVRDVFRALHTSGIKAEESPDEEQDPNREDTLPVLSDGLDTVIRAARARELLTSKDEIELGRRIKLAQQATKEGISHEEDRTEYDRIVERGHTAREKLVNANLLLVLAWARKYSAQTEFELNDLFQEGVIGLIK